VSVSLYKLIPNDKILKIIKKKIKKISNTSKVRKQSCEHVDGQCDLDF
jgi:hypothetical protein